MPAPEHIDRAEDPRVAAFADVKERHLKRDDGLFVAESERILARILTVPERLHSVILTPSHYERVKRDLEARAPRAIVYTAHWDTIRAIAGYEVRGVLALARRPAEESLELEPALGHLRRQSPLTLLIAEDLTDSENVGALFRNAKAFGVDGLVLNPQCSDPLYRKAIRVSVGHVLTLAYAHPKNWAMTLRTLKEEWGVKLVALETGRSAIPLWELPRLERVAFVLGSEGAGVAATTLELCDHIVEIPMAPGVESVNVATASALCLYEFRRMYQVPDRPR